MWNVDELIDWVTRNISLTPMTESTDVVFISPLNELPSGGTMTRSACGTMIRRITARRHAERRRRLELTPATESSPARMISAM